MPTAETFLAEAPTAPYAAYHFEYDKQEFENTLHKTKTVTDFVDNILNHHGLKIDQDSDEYKRICKQALEMLFRLDEKKKQFRSSLTLGPNGIEADKDSFPVQVEKKKPSGPSIGSLKDKWFNENIKADLWKNRTVKQYTGHFTILLQILGENLPIDSIDHSTVRQIKDTLLQLPAGMNKKKIFKDKTIPKILKINETAGHGTMNVTTINTYIVTLGAFFRWCVNNGYMTTNYADGAKIKVRKQKRPDEIREAFTTADLIVLFGSDQYRTDTFEESYQFWLPVLGLFTGARINELAQLRLNDIEVEGGIPFLELQEDPKDTAVSIKNTASMRTIPLHPFIVDDLNFMGHVESMRSRGETRLFPELPYQNHNYGHKATKWFGRYRKALGIDSKQKVFHSFRHTLSDNLKQQFIKDTIIEELTGHAVQGETMSRYGKRYPVETLYNEAVLKLDYKVNLEHLKGSKWTK